MVTNEFTLTQTQTQPSPGTLAFADADGVILDLFCDNRFSTCGSGSETSSGSRST